MFLLRGRGSEHPVVAKSRTGVGLSAAVVETMAHVEPHSPRSTQLVWDPILATNSMRSSVVEFFRAVAATK